MNASTDPTTAQPSDPIVRPDDSQLNLNDPAIARAVEEYRDLLAAGRRPDRQVFLARYSAIARELAACLDGLEFIHVAAPSLQEPDRVQFPSEPPGDSGLEPAVALGDFRIVREIGRGGMGVVYEAMQLSRGRRVALKVLPFAAVMDSKQLLRFKNEAHAAAQLHHTNIVPIFSVGSERGVHFYAMQFIEGQTLAEVVRELRRAAGLERKLEDGGSRIEDRAEGQRSALPRSSVLDPQSSTSVVAALSTDYSTRPREYFRTVARLGIQAAEALDHAHQIGIIHRDIKPGNLMLDIHGTLWITDFGLARVQNESNLTMTGDLIGTLRYMSPEQALAKRVVVDHRTDIYSLGVTLYELLTFRPVFSGDDRQEILRQIAFDEPRPPRRINDRIPPELETIVLKATAKNPTERYATASEFAEDLARFLNDEPIQARRPSLLRRSIKIAQRHQAIVGTIAMSALVLLLSAVAGLQVSNRLIREEKHLTEEALRAEAEQRVSAEANLRTAREAVDKYYTLVSQSTLLQDPSLIPLRRELLQSALVFYQEFLNQESDDPRIRGELAATYFRVAQITSESGSGEWLEPSRKAVEIVERLVQEGSDIRDHPSFMAGVYEQPGTGTAAKDHLAVIPVYEKGRAIWEKFVEQNPTSVGLRQDLAACYWQLGIEFLFTGQLNESLRYNILARDRWEILVDETNLPKYRRMLAATRESTARTYLKLQRFEEAEAELKKAIALQEGLLTDFPSVPSYKSTLAMALNGLAIVLQRRNRE